MTRVARALAAGALGIALLAGCTPETNGAASPTGGATTGGGTDPVPGALTSTPAPSARAVLTDPDLAAEQPADTLRALTRGQLAVTAAWDDRVATDLADWPVYVGDAEVHANGRVQLDVVVSVPPQEDEQLVLRWLPSARALGDAVQRLEVTVDGQAAETSVDRDGARVLVAVPADRPVTVRVEAAYAVPRREALDDDGSPAGIGLLARSPGTVALGHWLPLVTLESDDGPMQGRGDVGAFPAGAFSIRVSHESGTVVSGGRESACPGADDCTWLRGLGLRDVSAVLLTDSTQAGGGDAGPVAVHAASTTTVADDLEPAVEQGVAGLEALTDELGPLPWEVVDVVAVPISPGALGMEFPGMVWIDPSAWPEAGPELGAYVLAHELGHQWFHALVGNGSLSAPVVDESLAQYLSVVLFDELFGAGAGEELAASALGGRHEQAVADGVPDDIPAQPLDAFTTDRSYGAAVYGRAGQAWVEAEEAVGRDALLEALRELVIRHGLREVDERRVLDVVAEVAPDAAESLTAGWGQPTR